MQNNSGDLCLLIGIYSFILFYLLLLCVRSNFFFFSFRSVSSFDIICVCVCVCLNTDGLICSWNVYAIKKNRCSSLFAIYSHDHHQYHFQYTHAFDYFEFFFSSFASHNTEEKKCAELTFAQTVIMWSLWIALLILNGSLLIWRQQFISRIFCKIASVLFVLNIFHGIIFSFKTLTTLNSVKFD